MKRTVSLEGFSACLRMRVVKKKRRDKKGKTRGRYEGNYVYLTVKNLGTGETREIYLGRSGNPGAPFFADPKGVEKRANLALELANSPATSRGVEKRGRKHAEYDTRDEYDARQREMFGGARRRKYR